MGHIETTHNLAAVFRLFDNDYINHENLLQERYIVCASWMDLNEEEPHSVSTLDNPKLYKKNPHDDSHVVKTLHKVLSEADVIVAHNGDQYDIKFTEARMLFHNLDPLAPSRTIDTLKTAKKRFLFNSNKLDYLGNFLGVGRKKPTTDGLWLRILQGDSTAIDEMVDYNKQDVLLLKRIFLKLRPYMDDYINRQLFGGTGCPRCGSTHIQSRGVQRAITRSYQRFQCMDCGGWFRDMKPTPTKVTHRVI